MKSKAITLFIMLISLLVSSYVKTDQGLSASLKPLIEQIVAARESSMMEKAKALGRLETYKALQEMGLPTLRRQSLISCGRICKAGIMLGAGIGAAYFLWNRWGVFRNFVINVHNKVRTAVQRWLDIHILKQGHAELKDDHERLEQGHCTIQQTLNGQREDLHQLQTQATAHDVHNGQEHRRVLSQLDLIHGNMATHEQLRAIQLHMGIDSTPATNLPRRNG